MVKQVGELRDSPHEEGAVNGCCLIVLAKFRKYNMNSRFPQTYKHNFKHEPVRLSDPAMHHHGVRSRAASRELSALSTRRTPQRHVRACGRQGRAYHRLRHQQTCSALDCHPECGSTLLQDYYIPEAAGGRSRLPSNVHRGVPGLFWQEHFHLQPKV